MVNFENLQKLRDWLAANDVPFDMCQYRGYGYGRRAENPKACDLDGYLLKGKIPPECGSHGCTLGWSIIVPGLEPVATDFRVCGVLPPQAQLNYGDYCERVYGIDAGKIDGLWDFLFSSEWADTKYSSKEDAIARLDFVINNKVCSIESIDYEVMTAVVGSYA